MGIYRRIFKGEEMTKQIVCFRPHRGDFVEAMEEKKEFDTIGEFKQFIAGRPTIEYYTRDKRLPDGGETFIVTDATLPIGFMWFEIKEI